MTANSAQPGIYNIEYFSGSQVAIYIGDVLVDEITSIGYSVSQNRTPLYGYADTYFTDVSKGQVIVQGQFSINFKEAGYLWLILNRYKKIIENKGELYLGPKDPKTLGNSPFYSSSETNDRNIESIINGETTTFVRNRALQGLTDTYTKGELKQGIKEGALTKTGASLTGYSSTERAQGGVGPAESIFEDFEDVVWGKKPKNPIGDSRRCDDSLLNPFDIYVSFGDFAGDNRANHTVQKLKELYILSASKQIVIDGMPVQEVYQFLGKTII